MSYCRTVDEDGCDVYVIDSTIGWNCVTCGFASRRVWSILAHLEGHVERGERVPERVFLAIVRDHLDALG